jgi:hypothetical protein
MEGERDVMSAFDAFMEDMGQRFTIPRRIRERMRLIVATQRRIRDHRVGNLSRREFFADAALLHALDLQAHGQPVPAWAYDVSRYVEAGPKGKKKRGG